VWSLLSGFYPVVITALSWNCSSESSD
jgi:hypothetical protein